MVPLRGFWRPFRLVFGVVDELLYLPVFLVSRVEDLEVVDPTAYPLDLILARLFN